MYQSQRLPYGYEPTGDELFDRFAILVLKQLPKHTLHERINKTLQATGYQVDWDIDYSELAEWEDEYGGDPRYWQLRWLCDQAYFSSFGELGFTADIVKKIDEGVVDEGSYAAIDYFALYKADPSRALELIKQAIASAPDNAHFYYTQANLLQQYGANEAALDALCAGNAAFYNNPPKLYPFDKFESNPEYVVNKASQAVVGAISGLKVSAYLSMAAIPSVQLAKSSFTSCTSTISLETADELLAYARRFGERSDSDVLRILKTVVLLELVLDRVQEDGSAATADQARKLQQLVALSDKLKDKVITYVQSRTQQAQEPISAFQYCLDLYNEDAIDRKFVKTECLPILAEMAKIKLADNGDDSE